MSASRAGSALAITLLWLGCSSEAGGPAASADSGADVGLSDGGALSDVAATGDGNPDLSIDVSTPDLGSPELNTEQAALRVIHASPDAGPLELWIDDERVGGLGPIAYGQLSEPVPLLPGTHQVRVTRASESVGTTYDLTTEVTLPDGVVATAALAGLADARSEDTWLRLVFLTDPALPNHLDATVRFIHLAVGAPPLDIDVTRDATPERTELALWEEAGSALYQAASEPITVTIYPVYEGERGQGIQYTLDGRGDHEEVTILITGRIASSTRRLEGLALLPLLGEQAGPVLLEDPTLVAFHAAPNAPALDLFWQGRELADGLAFGSATVANQIPAGRPTLDLFPADWELSDATPPGDTDEPSGSTLLPELERGQRYLAVVTGLIGQDNGVPLGLSLYRDGFETAGAARARLIHAAPDGPALDLDGIVLWDDDVVGAGPLSFGESTSEPGIRLPLEPLHIPLVSVDKTLEASFLLEPESGMRLFLIAAGSLSSYQSINEDRPFGLYAVDAGEASWPSWPLEALAPD